jgi:hypothetical protein
MRAFGALQAATDDYLPAWRREVTDGRAIDRNIALAGALCDSLAKIPSGRTKTKRKIASFVIAKT